MASSSDVGYFQHNDVSSWGDSAEQLRQARLWQLEITPPDDTLIIGKCTVSHHRFTIVSIDGL